MIGVVSKKAEKVLVAEFFELFKTPWEFYRDNQQYDVVVLSTEDNISNIRANLVVIYGSKKTDFDRENKIVIQSRQGMSILKCCERSFPIYGKYLTFDVTSKPIIRIAGTAEIAGVEINDRNKKILRIGYDLFQEVHFLLSTGQPIQFAHIPTLEIHISMLRDWILDSGIPVIEVPPCPAGYDFITCLTHDVDFAGICNHRFDHTMLGFLYRATLGTFIDCLKGKRPWQHLLINGKAVLKLPFVYSGLAKDFWIQFDRYIDIEKDLGSTFFMIPFKNQAGQDTSSPAPKRRAARYDLTEIIPKIYGLLSSGCEVGLHGIDAWQDSKKGCKEFERISHAIGKSNIGVRMHWLYFCDRSPQLLENAGFAYDATFGYNGAVGYRGGTTQVFRPLGAKRLLELPLHIQDTALFYPKRMDLTETKALDVVNKLLKKTTLYGGVLTINWHHRSIAPERLWDDFYVRLIEKLKKRNTWFATAGDAVKWFHKRRALFFEEVDLAKNRVKLKLGGHTPGQQPGLLLRIHRPGKTDSGGTSSENRNAGYFDIPVEDKTEFNICG